MINQHGEIAFNRRIGEDSYLIGLSCAQITATAKPGQLMMLRVLTSDRGHKVRLRWRNGHAVTDGIDPNTAIEELAANMSKRGEAQEFSWADTPKRPSRTPIAVNANK